MLTVRQRYGQTDGRTDGRLTIAIPRFALRASRGKNEWKFVGIAAVGIAAYALRFVPCCLVNITCQKVTQKNFEKNKNWADYVHRINNALIFALLSNSSACVFLSFWTQAAHEIVLSWCLCSVVWHLIRVNEPVVYYRRRCELNDWWNEQNSQACERNVSVTRRRALSWFISTGAAWHCEMRQRLWIQQNERTNTRPVM